MKLHLLKNSRYYLHKKDFHRKYDSRDRQINFLKVLQSALYPLLQFQNLITGLNQVFFLNSYLSTI